MTHTIRWGVLSTGRIADDFARGFTDLPGADLVAVGSRSRASADAFADRHGIPNRHASYEALAADPEVDAIYIATPHTLHRDNSLLCLEAGKAVLCEKPFTINAREAEEVVRAARERGVFLMEAMWTRFLPHVVRLRELINEGAIGEPRILQADMGSRKPYAPEDRWYNREFGGGALLDGGVYPVSLAHMLFGDPLEIRSHGHIGETGVDEEVSLFLRHEGGRVSLLSSSIRMEMAREATLIGTDGRIRMHPEWWHPSTLTLSHQDEPDRPIDVPCPMNGYHYQVREVNRCLREGRIESDVMSHDATLEVMRILDTARNQWGLTYPMEETP